MPLRLEGNRELGSKRGTTASDRLESMAQTLEATGDRVNSVWLDVALDIETCLLSRKEVFGCERSV